MKTPKGDLPRFLKRKRRHVHPDHPSLLLSDLVSYQITTVPPWISPKSNGVKHLGREEIGLSQKYHYSQI